MTTLSFNEKIFKEREYQTSAWKVMREYLSQYLHKSLEEKPEGQIPTAMLIHMATGSGKTFTVGSFVNDIFELRRKFMKINKTTNVPRIHALVLNDRINLLNQLNIDFLKGRDQKNPLIDKKFQKTITSRIFHSKADNIYHEDDELLTDIGDIDIHTEGKGKDTFNFSTFQTAVNGLNIQQPNIIMIDEAHHLSAATYYHTFMNFYKPDDEGNYPLVILMSATPNKIISLTGDPLVQFGLPEWIASEYSPEVNYKLITNNNTTSEDIERINNEIIRISQIIDLKEKKREYKLLKEGEDGNGGIDAMLRRYNSNDELVLDLLERVEKLDHTIIFCPSIEIVDQVTALINFYKGDDNAAIAFHSKIDEADDTVLAKYNTGQSKVIVAVGKLNEGIDMPQTNNVVFWRETDSETIFQQQFGRGLRGDEVNIFDYVGGIKNLAWINTINQAIDKNLGDDKDDGDDNYFPSDDKDGEDNKDDGNDGDDGDDKPKNHKNINIVIEGVGDSRDGISHILDLQDLVWRLEGLEISCELTKTMIEDYFKTKPVEERKLLKTKERAALKIGGNGLNAIARLYNIKENPVGNQNIWYDLLEKIFGVSIQREEMQELTKTMVEDYFKTKPLEERKLLKKMERAALKIGGNGLNAITRLYNIKENPLYQNIWYDLLEKIFGVSIQRDKMQELTKTMVEDYFKTKPLEERKLLKKMERAALKIGGNGLFAIATLYDIKEDPVVNQNIWYDLLEKIFGVSIQREEMQELTKTMVEDYFKTKPLEERKLLKTKERAALKIGGNGLFAIATLYDIKEDPVVNQNIWYDLLEKIFGVSIQREELTKTMVEDYFKTKPLEERKLLKTKERAALKIGGNGLNAIARLYDIKEDPVGNQNIWYDLLEKIFGVSIQREELTKTMIEDYFKTKPVEERKLLKKMERAALKIEGNGLNAIARLYNIKENPVTNKNIWYDLLEKIFGVIIQREELTKKDVF